VAESSDYGPSTYGDRIAAFYDEWFGLPTDTGPAVEFLASMAGEGPVLELGIGTGRVALPLVGRGLQVHGIDASEAMVAKLRQKPGGDRISVASGDFANVDELVEGAFSLVFVVFNTFFALLTQDDQVRCFQGVAQHLAENGAFLMQAFVPDVTRFDRGQRVEATDLGADIVHVEASRYDPVDQRVTSQHVVVEEGRTRLFPVCLRFAYPSELDLMAAIAGMRLRERWGGWDRRPFDSSSQQHVSVWERIG
jgi:SAM-dependent methyltransferase